MNERVDRVAIDLDYEPSIHFQGYNGRQIMKSHNNDSLRTEFGTFRVHRAFLFLSIKL